MARPRTPKAKAKATGQDIARKEKFKARNEPLPGGPVGDPPLWLNVMAQAAWREIVDEVPWLTRPHRGFLAIAASIRGRMMAGDECGVQSLNLLRMAYGQMGATPADASKAGRTNDGEQIDPAEDYFK